MKIRWNFPLMLFIHGPSADALELSDEFIQNDLTVKFSLLGEKPSPFQTAEKTDAYFRTVRAIHFKIEDIKTATIQESLYPKILKIMVLILNRVLRGIRNAGVVAAVNEINPPESEAEKFFRKWSVETSENGESWTLLIKEDPMLAIMSALFPDSCGELNSSLLSDIRETIIDNISPSPEQEFVVNCIEYLHNRNYRMAVVESVTCLDIVTSQYLNSYLATYKNISKNRRDRFLQPQLGLSARIACLLDLCLNPDDTKKVEFDNIFTAIGWRNEIIHKSGHLPRDLPDEIIITRILSVLELVNLLAGLRNQIENMPELQEIGKKISKQTSAPLPNISIVGKHKIVMEFTYFAFLGEFPDLEKLNAVAQEAKKLLSERDKRFCAEEHLYIRFYSFPNELRAIWRKGILNPVQKTPEKISNQS